MKDEKSGKDRVTQSKVDERRRFERIGVPSAAQLSVTDKKGNRLGVIRQLGRGGMMLETDSELKKDKSLTAVIVDEPEGIRRAVEMTVRYVDARFAGCEFDELSPDAAVEIGILIGKYYSGSTSD